MAMTLNDREERRASLDAARATLVEIYYPPRPPGIEFAVLCRACGEEIGRFERLPVARERLELAEAHSAQLHGGKR